MHIGSEERCVSAKVHPFLRIYKLWGRFLWVFATEINGICGFCRKNQGMSRVVEEKSERLFGIGGFLPYLCIIEIKIEIHTIRDISCFILHFTFVS